MGFNPKTATLAFTLAFAAVANALPQIGHLPPPHRASGPISDALPTTTGGPPVAPFPSAGGPPAQSSVPKGPSSKGSFPNAPLPHGFGRNGTFTNGTALNATATPTKSHAPATGLAVASNVPTDEVFPCRAPYGQQNGCSFCNTTMGVKPGKIDSAPFNPFNDTAYGSSTGMPGYSVWFSIPQPKSMCKTLIIIPAHDAEPAFGTVGVTIVSAEQAGCYGATLQSSGYAVASCCGDKDCNTVGAGQLKKREADFSPYERIPREYQETKEASKAASKLDKRYTTFQQKGVTSPDEPPQPKPSDSNGCKPAVLQGGGAITRAGSQQVNETQYYCNGVGGEPCSLSWGLIVSSSQSVTVSNSSEHSHTDQNSVSVSAGWNSIEGPTASVTGTIGTEDAKTLQKSLGMETSNATETLLTYTMSQVPNSYAKLSFVPYLNCLNYTMECGDGKHSVEWCHPGDPRAGYPMLMYTG